MKYFVLFGNKYPIDLDKPYDEKDYPEVSEEFIEARKNLVASWSQMPIDQPLSDLYRKLEQELDKSYTKNCTPMKIKKAALSWAVSFFVRINFIVKAIVHSHDCYVRA